MNPVDALHLAYFDGKDNDPEYITLDRKHSEAIFALKADIVKHGLKREEVDDDYSGKILSQGCRITIAASQNRGI